METPLPTATLTNQLTDIVGLRACGIFPKGKEPSIRTLRDWTKLRRIPFHRVGHFIYFDPVEVGVHIRTKLIVPPRG
jgi:hypothetical protein